MLSGMALLGNLLSIGGDGDSGSGLTGRRVYSSAALIRDVLDAELLTGNNVDVEQNFEVYVAAMSAAAFEAHLPDCSEKLAVIVGDRPDIQMRAAERGIKLLIITGDRPVKDEVMRVAEKNQMTLLRTGLDSAAAIRRLKFSVPVRFAVKSDEDELQMLPGDRLRDVKKKILDHYAYFLIVANVQNDAERGRNELTNNGSDRRTENAHFGKTEITEYENGVENDVHYRARALRNHTQYRFSSSLKESFTEYLYEDEY
jgi:hypothetical protein